MGGSELMDTFKFGFTETVIPLDDYNGEKSEYVLLGLYLYINEEPINCFTDIKAFLYPTKIITESYHPYDRKRSISCKGKLVMV